jgi:hypothetical protein
MKKLLVAMLLLYPLSALAVTYEWTDDRGTVNFTEDLGKVPKKYRKKAKVLDGEDSGAPQSTVIGEPAKGKAKSDEPPKGKKLYGGKDENAWRSEFVTATGDLQHAEAGLQVLRGRLADTSKMTRGEYLSIQSSIKNEEARVQQMQKKLDLLQQSADRLGVPMEFRR